MRTLEQVIPSTPEVMPRREEEFMTEAPLASKEAPSALGQAADCGLEESPAGAEAMRCLDEEMSAIEQEIDAPQEVIIADDGVMAAEIFDPERDYYEDGEPCAVHEAPLALTFLLFFYCRTGATRHSP